MTQLGYEQYLSKKGAYRNLLTWNGVVAVPKENVSDFLESLYVKNYEAAITNIERKEKQSAAAKKRNAEKEARQAAFAPGSSSAQADASSPTVPEPKTPPKAPPSRSAQADAPSASSHLWSWNRDHYGSRREWTQWRGNWYYRDDRNSRWIYWGR